MAGYAGYEGRPSVERRNEELAALTHAAGLGDPAAIQQLLARLAPLIRSMAWRAQHRARYLGVGPALDLEDLEQEARLALIDLARTYRPAAGQAMYYFLHRLPQRLWRRIHRVARQHPKRSLHAASAPGTVALVDASERLWQQLERDAEDDRPETLRAAINRLPLRDRRVLYLRFWSLRTNVEVARMLGISDPAANKAVQRALRHLRAELGRVGFGRRYGLVASLVPSASLPTKERSAAGTATEPSAC